MLGLLGIDESAHSMPKVAPGALGYNSNNITNQEHFSWVIVIIKLKNYLEFVL